MENRSKFYTNGLWADDTLFQRYEHVKYALDAFCCKLKIMDKQDLMFAIKNAFVSSIYVSEGVVKAYPLDNDTPNILGSTLYPLYKELVKTGKLSFGNKVNNCSFFDICKIVDRIYSENRKLKKNGSSGLTPILIEHVVPGDIYIDDAIYLNSNSSFDQNEFVKIFNSVSICLVTKREDDTLNKKGLKQIMPPNNLYKTAPFARYKGAGVNIHKLP